MQCPTGKRCETYKQAVRHLGRLRQLRTTLRKDDLTIYQCSECGMYHVGHRYHPGLEMMIGTTHTQRLINTQGPEGLIGR